MKKEKIKKVLLKNIHQISGLVFTLFILFLMFKGISGVIGDNPYAIGENHDFNDSMNTSIFDAYYTLSDNLSDNAYRHFYIYNDTIVSNIEGFFLARQKICFSIYCADSLQINDINFSDNLTYAKREGYISNVLFLFNQSFSINLTDKRMLIKSNLQKKSILFSSVANISYVTYALNFPTNRTYIQVDGKSYSVYANNTIIYNMTRQTYILYNRDAELFIQYWWEDSNATIKILNNEIWLSFPKNLNNNNSDLKVWFLDDVYAVKIEHWNNNKSFVTDFTLEGSQMDDLNYTVPNNEFAYVIFSQNITDGAGLDLRANASNGRIEVYLNNTDVLVGFINNVSNYDVYYIRINMSGQFSDNFILKSIGDITYDKIHDAVTYCAGNYTQGQVSWNITSNITCANQTIYVAGNITIFNNGSLTLYNVTINFSAFAAGSNSINKSPNGGLYIYDLDSNASTQEDATEIISNNSNQRYNFWVFGNGANDNFTMKNSKVISSGYGARSLGIHLYNVSNVVIAGNNISGGLKFGLILNSSNNNNVSGNFINETASTNIVIYLDSSASNTIQSNTLVSDNVNSRGIYLKRGSDSNIIRSNIIKTYGNVDHGIFSQLTNANLLIESNTITTTGNGSIGMYIQATSESNITRNKINTSGRNADSIYIFGDSNNNKVDLNNISNSGRSGIRFETLTTLAIPERNNITNNIIINSTADGIFLNNTLTSSQLIQGNNITYSGLNYAAIRLNNASNITIIGGIIENNTIGINASGSVNITIANATFIGNTLWDFYITNNSWVTSLNNTFNRSAVNVTGSSVDFSNFTNQYYVDVNVTQADSSFSAVSGATVYAYENTTGAWAQEWTDTTASTGFTGKWATTEYTQNGTTVVNYTSNFTASYGAKINSTAKYITSSQQVDVRIPAITKFCSGNYTEGQATWNITSNITCANQTIYVAGNITIFNNGSLTLYNVTINFSMFADGSNFINKSPNGGLYIYDLDSNASTQYDATRIISNDSSYQFGFWVFGNGGNDNFTMQNSVVKDAGYSGNSYGIQLYNISNVVVSGNNVSSINTGYGIYLLLSSNNNIKANTYHDTRYGIVVNSSSNNNITQNTIYNNSFNGITLLLSSERNSIINNIVYNNSQDGIYVDSSSENNITNNTIYGNGRMGVYLFSSSNNNTLAGNTIYSNVRHGISIALSGLNNITGNIINTSGANFDGIYIFSTSRSNRINLNNISKSGRDGIRIEGSAENLPERNNITNNIILNSTEHGIFANNTLNAYQLIQGNNISYSGNFSLLLSNASNITIIGGSLEYSKIGINATNSINITVTNATFVLNTLWDFYVTNNSWVISLNNSFNKSGVNVTNYLGDFSNFTNQYYVDVNVTWSNSTAVSGATVFAYENSTGSWAAIWNETTASNGFTGKWATTEYFQNGTNIINYTSNFTANYSGQANSTIKYISSSQQVDVRLNSTAAPANFCNGSYTAGQATWDITSNITCANETIYVAGNITIFNNGSLTLYNVTINFSMFADGSGFINKSSNGGLFIYDLDSNASTQEDATEIISNNSNYEYNFWAFGNGLNDNLTIRNSKFADAGYAVRSLGIYLYNVSNARVIGNNISGGAKRGFFLESSTNNNIINNTVNNDGIAVFLEGSSSNNISNNIITTSSANAHGILISVRSNLNLIQSNTITPSGPGSHGIQLATNSSSNNISSNKINITGTSLDGINLITTSNNNIINLNNITFARNGINVGDSATERNNITNNRILNSTQNGIVINDTLNAYQFIYNNNITYSGLNYAGIFLNNASNITIIGGVLENNTIAINATMSRNVTITNATIIGSALWDFYITNNSWVISLNNTFNKTLVNVTGIAGGGDYSNFTVKWYVTITTDQNPANANSTNLNESIAEYTDQTTPTGLLVVKEYLQNATSFYNYTYNFSATKSGYDVGFNVTAVHYTQTISLTLNPLEEVRRFTSLYFLDSNNEITALNEPIMMSGMKRFLYFLSFIWNKLMQMVI